MIARASFGEETLKSFLEFVEKQMGDEPKSLNEITEERLNSIRSGAKNKAYLVQLMAGVSVKVDVVIRARTGWHYINCRGVAVTRDDSPGGRYDK